MVSNKMCFFGGTSIIYILSCSIIYKSIINKSINKSSGISNKDQWLLCMMR